MSQSNSSLTTFSKCLLAVATATIATAARAQAPQIGDSQVVSAVSICLHVGSTGKESKQASYTPPPGWHIRRHYVTCTEFYGNSSYTVSVYAAGWVWSSDTNTRAIQQHRLELAAPTDKYPVQAKMDLRHNESSRDRSSVSASHHALVVNATAIGEGLFRGGGGVQMRVIAELVYVGQPEVPIRAELGTPISEAKDNGE